MQDRLKAIDPEYPSARDLAAKVKSGIVAYGMAGVGEGCDSEGSEALIAVVDKPDERPVYIGFWGGGNVLAQVRDIRCMPGLSWLSHCQQALWKVRKTR